MIHKIWLEKKVYIFMLIMFFVFPTSINKSPHSNKIIVVLWLMQSICILIIACVEKIDKKQLVLALLGMIYLFIATMVAFGNENLYISIAGIAPIICFFCLCCVKNQGRIKEKFFLRLLDIMCVVLILWNLLTLMRIQVFIEFVNNFYTQLDTYTATYWSLVNNKPIFTFGVHNFGAVFYMHIFLMVFFSYETYKKRRYLFYMSAIFIFTLLLKSSSSAGMAGIMLLLLFKVCLEDKRKTLLMIVSLLLVFVILAESNLIGEYIKAFSSKGNGFLGRYSNETSLYEGNYAILEKYPLGIGFLIGNPEANLYFGDSGYIIYYTMGRWLLPILCFVLIYRYFKINLNLKMAIILIIVVALTELTLISFTYTKTLYLYAFEIGFYSSILDIEGRCKQRRLTNDGMVEE